MQTVSIVSNGGWLRSQQPGLFSRVVGTSVNNLAIIQAVRHGHRSIDQVVLYRLDRPGTSVAIQPDTNHAERNVHWDQQENIFYLGNTQLRPAELHLFAVRVDRLTANRSDCLTCSPNALGGGYEQVRLRRGGMVNVKLLLPATYEVNFNAGAIAAAAKHGGVNRSFALLVRAYNGPDSFAGTATWTDSYEEYLAVNRSVVVAIVDARDSSRSNLQDK